MLDFCNACELYRIFVLPTVEFVRVTQTGGFMEIGTKLNKKMKKTVDHWFVNQY